ncbi:fimbrial protein [Serratia sp. JSRIV001]|uniref:fimbrial protein n=1 Tax=unclassified Serratia (in: enterobacteria) TaxID=2647522 RepID=UPI001CC00465|nr:MULTISPECIES: fimbrial protein [unclassified Serratia (in: enterobacteria)]UAN45180.1 fimbrial protein [Serratia sp. JSRIV001]UAN45204.1 fimbrial protein [Serratia sp. JSRIV001]UAN54522.1 fimbrial protein [Serratia sp. JSRIV002]UAN60534.1 fimbrial protein [Serratia sp. JSRIV004]
MKKIMKVKELMKFGLLLALLGGSSQAMAFYCAVSGGGSITNTGDQNVEVYLTPEVQQNQNLIIDLSSMISCKFGTANENPVPGAREEDYLYIAGASYSGGVLDGFKGNIYYYSENYSVPGTTQSTARGVFPRKNGLIPMDVKLYLSPLSNNNVASGVLIAEKAHIATLIMQQRNNVDNGGERQTWFIYAKNSVVMPVGGCDVSARDVSVTLPAYDATSNQTFSVPLSVNCPSGNKNLSYFLSGTTADTAGKIFSNTSTSSPASGIGIQMLDQNNNAITVNNAVPLGTVGNTPVNLNLKATYAQTGAQVTAGNVQSVIGVTFTYP